MSKMTEIRSRLADAERSAEEIRTMAGVPSVLFRFTELWADLAVEEALLGVACRYSNFGVVVDARIEAERLLGAVQWRVRRTAQLVEGGSSVEQVAEWLAKGGRA